MSSQCIAKLSVRQTVCWRQSTHHRPMQAHRVRRMRVVSNTLRSLYRWKRPGEQCTGGWVVLEAGLDAMENLVPPPGFNPWTVQPVACRY
jgi:hypothetical protein